MNRTAYWSVMTVAALMAGVLLATPVWDYFHYGKPAAAGVSLSSAASAAGPGAPAQTASLAGAAGPSAPTGPSAPASNPLAGAGSGIPRGGSRTSIPEAPPGPARPGPALGAPKPAAVAGPAAVRPAALAAATPRPSSPAGPGPAPGPQTPTAPPPAKSPSPANQTASQGWIAGGFLPAPPATPAPQATPPPHDAPAPEDRARPPATGDTGSGSDDATPLRLSLAPDRSSVSRGDTFSVQVNLTGARDITSVPFHLLFDPGVLEYVGARTGPALDGRSLQPIFLASVNPSRPGDLAVGLSLVRSSGAFNGSGAIVLIDFRALAPGRSDLRFDRASVRGPASQPLAADIVDSAAEVR